MKTFIDFSSIRQGSDILFADFVSFKTPYQVSVGTGFSPPTDVYETNDEFVITMEIAGIKKENISVIAGDKVITISGFRSEKPVNKRRNYHKMEINYGHFERSVIFNVFISLDDITANYKDGFLQVVVPKLKNFEQINSKKIDVNIVINEEE